MKREYLIFSLIALVVLFSSLISAESQNVCCEKTKSGLFCQNVPSDQCAVDAKQAPTSCASTSFCKPGVCYSPSEGTCMDNTPQLVCNAKNASWFAGTPAQCELGCCTLGDQAAFVSLVRCKRLAASLGLSVSYNKKITSETACVLSVKNQDRGACVYDYEFEKSCKFTTRGECDSGANGTGKGTFYADKLCTAPELGTTCGKTDRTTCVAGKDEVYFVDTCGNVANVYDSSKIDNVDYWTNVKKPENSCNPSSNNAGSSNCGNCNYILGSTCREKTTGSDTHICVDLNCQDTTAGFKRHGESWCIYSDAGNKDVGKSSVGSRYFRHVCLNGKEYVEPCADFRQEECIQGKITTALGDFSQAACRVNRWQDCTSQNSEEDCINTDKRDCLWLYNATCVAKNPTGLKFWTGTDASTRCGYGSATCTVTYSKKLLGGEKCEENCDCLSVDWATKRIALCNSLGDCGVNINWLNVKGYGNSYNLTFGARNSSD